MKLKKFIIGIILAIGILVLPLFNSNAYAQVDDFPSLISGQLLLNTDDLGPPTNQGGSASGNSTTEFKAVCIPISAINGSLILTPEIPAGTELCVGVPGDDRSPSLGSSSSSSNGLEQLAAVAILKVLSGGR